MNEQALKERIKHIAKFEERTFHQVWRDLTLQRLLVRLSQSSYTNQLIFKGGLLLAHYIYLGRETKDMDLQTEHYTINKETMKAIFKKICQVKINDGFRYTFSTLSILNMEHMHHPGYRVHLNLTFGTIKDRIQIDVALGEIREAKKKSLKLSQYKGVPVFEDKIPLWTYPLETTFAEKLKSTVIRGGTNSRMKDYHDLLLLCREKNIFNFEKLRKDVSISFRNVSKSVPVKFSNDELNNLQKLWTDHRNGLYKIANRLDLPIHIKDIVTEINHWLSKNNIFT